MEEERRPAGETQPAGQNPASPAMDGKPEGIDAGEEDWARAKLEWMLMNCIALKMRELDEVMRALRERRS